MKKINIKRLIVILFLLLLAIGAYINVKGEFLQYKELGENYISIFKTNVGYNYVVTSISFILLYFIIYFTTRGIKKGLKVFFDEEKKAMPKLPNKSISLIISAILSIIIGIILTPKIILLASNVSFEQTDGIFNLDISFYMFAEPLIKAILTYSLGLIVFLIIYTVLYYIIVFNQCFDGIDRETLKKSSLTKHIIRYIKFIAIGFAIYTLVGTLDIVFSNFIKTNSDLQLTGAGIADVYIKLWGNIIFAFIIVISIFKAIKYCEKHEKIKMIKSLSIIPIYLIILFLGLVLTDLIFLSSNEYDKEKTYIEKNIEHTKTAYGINCEQKTIEYSGTITKDQIEKNSNIINNSAIVTQNIALENLNNTQTEKGYYKYVTAGVSKYFENGQVKLVYMSPREIVNNKRTYNSKTYEYTHGYGAILTSASEFSEDGTVQYLKEENIKVPQIYYGLETNNIAVINNENNSEYDYTDSKGNEYKTTYIGNSGLNLGFFDRLVLSFKTGDFNLAFGSNSKTSKVLINRNIIKRAETALSDENIIYDNEPYIVVDEDGQMYWILDGYTISSNYPYSTYTTIQYNGEKKTINYIRNSIKVIINCYNGEMKFYITDTTDPIAMAYKKIYPNLFEEKESKIPESISKNFVYPKFLYKVQSSMLQEYHNTKSEVLYRGDDSWKKATYVATQSNKTSSTTLDSYYTMVKNGEQENIGLIQLYTPNEKQNLTAYLVGTFQNGENKLTIYNLSSDTSILGLTQLDSTISQDENIKSEIDSLNVTGAKVTKNIMVVPVDNTLLYIEQIYQTKTNESNIPILKKIIVASGNKVAIGDNLKSAIENLVSQDATSIDTFSTDDVDSLIKSIIKANDNLSESMNSKDWELMGGDVKKLQELIVMLKKETENEEKLKENKNQNVVNEISNMVNNN